MKLQPLLQAHVASPYSFLPRRLNLLKLNFSSNFHYISLISLMYFDFLIYDLTSSFHFLLYGLIYLFFVWIWVLGWFLGLVVILMLPVLFLVLCIGFY